MIGFNEILRGSDIALAMNNARAPKISTGQALGFLSSAIWRSIFGTEIRVNKNQLMTIPMKKNKVEE